MPASLQSTAQLCVDFDTLHVTFPHDVAASLCSLFLRGADATALQYVGELLLPRVHRHLLAESSTVASLLGLHAPPWELLSRAIVGMLLELHPMLLYTSLVHAAYLRSAVCESLHVLWSSDFMCTSRAPHDSALGVLQSYARQQHLAHSGSSHDQGTAMALTSTVPLADTPPVVRSEVLPHAGSIADPAYHPSMPWAEEDFFARLVFGLCTAAHRRKSSRSIALRAELDSAVRAAVDATSVVIPAMDCVARLRLACSRLSIQASRVEPVLDILIDRIVSEQMHAGRRAASSIVGAEGWRGGLRDVVNLGVSGLATPVSDDGDLNSCHVTRMSRVRAAPSDSSPIMRADAAPESLPLSLRAVTDSATATASSRLHGAASSSSLLPDHTPSPCQAHVFFAGGGSAMSADVGVRLHVPAGKHSTSSGLLDLNSSSRLMDSTLLDDSLRVNVEGHVVFTTAAKSIWLDDPSDVRAATSLQVTMADLERVTRRPPSSSASYTIGVPEGYRHSNTAIANASRARRISPSISWNGVPYPQRTLGVWRRMFCEWRARITGWFTSAEYVQYFSLIVKIEKGLEGAAEQLASLLHRTRYVNGRLPGCSRYSELAIMTTFKWNARLAYCVSASLKSRTYGCPLDYYGFTVSQHPHGSILRLRSVPLWCYFRHKSESKCMFGLEETATQEHRSAQQKRVEERAAHFSLYVSAHTRRYGPPVQVNKGCLPGAFVKGASQAGLEVAGIDLSGKSTDYEREFHHSRSDTRVTFTLGDALDDSSVAQALDKHPGLIHTSTFAAFHCQPHCSVNHLRPEQGLDASGRILNTALGVDRRAYRMHGITWFNESVVGSIANVSEQYKHIIITGFLTGESSVDRHAIYYEDTCPPLIDDELREGASWIASHSCGGSFRPFQHLGPDNVPVFMGERDPSDPSKWVRYMKKGGGWVNRRPWTCCKGSAMVVFGNMPPGVTHEMWCKHTGNSPSHIRDTQQLRNALWPRLGLLLGPQLHMYWMAGKYGLPVVDFPESRRDPCLLAWLHSILFCQGVWPRMPFQHYHFVLTPVTSPGCIVVTSCGHLLETQVRSRSSTLVGDLATALSQSYPRLALDAKDLRFSGMLNLFSPYHLIFSSEVIDDDALQTVPAGNVASFRGASRVLEVLVSVPITSYLAFLNSMSRLGVCTWGLDLVILRSYLQSELAATRDLTQYLAQDEGCASHVAIERGRYKSISVRSRSPVSDVYQRSPPAVVSRVLRASAFAGGGKAMPQVRRVFRVHGTRPPSSRPRNSQLSFDDQLAHLCPETDASLNWAPQRSVVNSLGVSVSVPCPVRVLTHALAREIMPGIEIPTTRASVALPDNHFHDTTYSTWSARYHEEGKRLGIDTTRSGLKDLGADVLEAPLPGVFFVTAQAVCCLPSHNGCVLVVARGRRLILLADRRGRITRGACLALVSKRAAELAPMYGRCWLRAPAPPSAPVPYSSLKDHYVLNRRRQHTVLAGHRLDNHALVRFVEGVLRREPATQGLTITNAQCTKFGVSAGPSHYIRTATPSQRGHDRRNRVAEVLFTTVPRIRELRRIKRTNTRALESLSGVLHRSVEAVSPSHCVYDFDHGASAFWLIIVWCLDAGLSTLHLSLLSRHSCACVLAHLYGRYPLGQPRRLLDMRVDRVAALARPSASATVPIRASDTVGYDIRYESYVMPLPSLSFASVPPVMPDGSVRRAALAEGTLYSCPVGMLVEHFASTGRSHLSFLVKASLTAPVVATATSALASGRKACLCDAATVELLVASCVSLGDHATAVLLSSCCNGMRDVSHAVWRSHMDYSRTPYIDLACDWRVMSALHRRTKWVETRFARGALRHVRAGTLCRTWCPRPSVSEPASKFPSWSYIAAVVFDRSFQGLYERFGSAILPGLPRDYVCSIPFKLPTRLGLWHASEVEQVYMSMYHAHYPTVDSWRASQRRGAYNVVGFVLEPLPDGFTIPQGLPLNPRRQILTLNSPWVSDDRASHAAVVLQCYARRYLLKGYGTRVRSFRCMVHHFALLNSRDLVINSQLRVTYGMLASWARYDRPRFVGYGAALRLQMRWRSWLAPTPHAVLCDRLCSRAQRISVSQGPSLQLRALLVQSCWTPLGGDSCQLRESAQPAHTDSCLHRGSQLRALDVLTRTPDVAALAALRSLWLTTVSSRPFAVTLQRFVRGCRARRCFILLLSARLARRSILIACAIARPRRPWVLIRSLCVLIRLFIARRSCRKVTRTGRAYATGALVTYNFDVYPSSPHFRIDDLVVRASQLLVPQLRRVVQVPRDGSCLLHAVAACVPLNGEGALADADVALMRTRVAEWVCSRVRDDASFAADVAAELSDLDRTSRTSSVIDAAVAAHRHCNELSVAGLCTAYAAYVQYPDSYCGPHELEALSCVYRMSIRVLRVANSVHTSLVGSSLSTCLDCVCDDPVATATVLLTNSHYDAVVPFHRMWFVVRSLWTLSRILCSVRRLHRALVLPSGGPLPRIDEECDVTVPAHDPNCPTLPRTTDIVPASPCSFLAGGGEMDCASIVPGDLLGLWLNSAAHGFDTPVVEFYSHKHGPYRSFSNFLEHESFKFCIPEVCNSTDLTSSGRDALVDIRFAEKAIMLCKASLMRDYVTYDRILCSQTSQEAKALGRTVSPWDQDLWQRTVCRVAVEVVYAKFSLVTGLDQVLLSTGSRVIGEMTSRDANWGTGIDIAQPGSSEPSSWEGTNMLGWALMVARSYLRKNLAWSTDAPSDQDDAPGSSGRILLLQAQVASINEGSMPSAASESPDDPGAFHTQVHRSKSRSEQRRDIVAAISQSAISLSNEVVSRQRRRTTALLQFNQVFVPQPSSTSQDDSSLPPRHQRSLPLYDDAILRLSNEYEDRRAYTILHASQNFIFTTFIGADEPSLLICHRHGGKAFVVGGKLARGDGSMRRTCQRETMEEANLFIPLASLVFSGFYLGDKLEARWSLMDYACCVSSQYAASIVVSIEHTTLEWVPISGLHLLDGLDRLEPRARAALVSLTTTSTLAAPSQATLSPGARYKLRAYIQRCSRRLVSRRTPLPEPREPHLQVDVEELFCDVCGLSGAIDNRGRCESCTWSPTHVASSATSLLTFINDPSCS